MSIKDIRRENMRTLAKSVGGITKLAERLDKSQSQISHLIGAFPIKNVGHKIASQVEAAFGKPMGWLDREHIYSEESQIICHQVPLITWQEVRKWSFLGFADKPHSWQLIGTTALVSRLAFALQVQGDSMQASFDISFPEGTIIIADPEQVAKPTPFVIATVNDEDEAILRQLISDGNKRYLKPLNPRYPVAEFSINSRIYAVVKQMLFNFDV